MYTNRHCRTALEKLETVVSFDAKTRRIAAFLDSGMGKKVLHLKENGEPGRLPDFGESKVDGVRVGVLEFALSPTGRMAREMGNGEPGEIVRGGCGRSREKN